MARTGRFGRLPTESPDLSSQIVSLMEQYYAGQDRGMLDAWTNGGTYQGKKVNDRDILKHYRKRRDGFDKDDPMYDQWNQDLWQMRYQISDEQVQMKYRMGKIGPRAVAAHYRKWAKKMPRNSSFYRNLMAAHGDYLKAAAAGRSAGGGGGSSNAYATLQRRIKDLDKQGRESTEALDLLSEYARRRQYIGPDEDITTPGAFDNYESADFQLMLDGVENWPEWNDWVAGQRANGYTTFSKDDGLTREDITAAIRENNRIARKRIAAYKAYPGDMSSYIQADRNTIRNNNAILRHVKPGGLIDTKADWNEAWLDFMGQPGDETGWANSQDSPSQAINDVDGLINETARLRRKADRMGDTPTALFAEILLDTLKAGRDSATTDEAQQLDVSQRLTALQQQYPDFTTDFAGGMFASPGAFTQFGSALQIVYNGERMLADGTGVKVYHTNNTPGELSLGAIGGPNYEVWALDRSPDGAVVARDPNSDASQLVGGKTTIVTDMYVDEGGNYRLEPVLLTAKPVFQGQREVGVVWEHNGARLFGQPDPDNPGLYNNTPFNPWNEAGMTTEFGSDRVTVRIEGEEDFTTEAEAIEAFTPIEPVSMGNIREAFHDQMLDIEADEDISEEDREAQIKGLEIAAESSVSGNFDEVLNNSEARQAWLKVQPGDMLQNAQLGSYTGEEYEAAEKAMVEELLRQEFNVDIPYTEESALYVTPQGGLRNSVDVEMLRIRGTDDEVQKRSQYVADAEAAGVPYAQFIKNMGPELGGGTSGIPPEAINQGRGLTPPAGAAVDDGGAYPNTFSEHLAMPENAERAQQFGYQAALENYVKGLADAGTNSPEVGFIIADLEKREVLHENPNLFLPIIALSAQDQAQAEAMLDDVQVVLTENGMDDMLKPLAAKSGFRETEQGFAYGTVTAQQALEGALGEKFGEENDLFGGSLNIYGGEPAETTRPSFFGSAADYAGVSRPSETTVQPRDPVADVKQQPNINVAEPLGNVAGVSQNGTVKVSESLKASTYIQQVASAPNPMAAAAISPVKVSPVGTYGVKVHIPSVTAAQAELTPAQWSQQAKAAASYKPPAPPSITDAMKVIS